MKRINWRYALGCVGGCMAVCLIGFCAFAVWAIAITQEYRDIPVESEAHTVEYDGLTRSYRLYVGENYDEDTPSPLVFIVHGGGGDGSGAEKLTLNGFNRLADEDGFIIVYPEGIDEHCQYQGCYENGDHRRPTSPSRERNSATFKILQSLEGNLIEGCSHTNPARFRSHHSATKKMMAAANHQ